MDREEIEKRVRQQMERLERRGTRRTARALAKKHAMAALEPLLERPPPDCLTPELQKTYREELVRLIGRVDYHKTQEAPAPPA
jgi:hypothetical protein